MHKFLLPLVFGLLFTVTIQAEEVQVTVYLRHNAQALARYAADVGNPEHKRYGRYLTFKQIRSRYGLGVVRERRLNAWLKRNGVGGSYHGNGLTYRLDTSIETFNRVFRTHLEQRTRTDGGSYFVANPAPTVPPALRGIVTGFHGLKELGSTIRRQPISHNPKQSNQRTNLSARSSSSINCLNSLIANYYGIPSQTPVPNPNFAQTIAITEWEGEASMPSDYQQFVSQCAPNVTSFSVLNPSPQDSASAEATADTQIIGAAAPPNVKVVVYEVNTNTYDLFGLTSIPNLTVISSSDSVPESVFASGGLLASSFGQYQSLFNSLAAAGVTWSQAAGDAGSSNYGCASPVQLAVLFPSAPTVSMVGGTQLSSTGSILTTNTLGQEVVWNIVGTAYGFPPGQGSCPAFAGGGGMSSLFVSPSYQAGLAGASNSARNIPDVSMLAWYYQIFYQCPSSGVCQPEPFEGTSAAAPLFASGVLWFNAYQGRPSGNINPLLYQIAASANQGAGTSKAVLTDITMGNNDISNLGGYSAGVGYDMASGLGTVNFNNLIGFCANPLNSKVC